jgi:hypothetical protein
MDVLGTGVMGVWISGVVCGGEDDDVNVKIRYVGM